MGWSKKKKNPLLEDPKKQNTKFLQPDNKRKENKTEGEPASSREEASNSSHDGKGPVRNYKPNAYQREQDLKRLEEKESLLNNTKEIVNASPMKNREEKGQSREIVSHSTESVPANRESIDDQVSMGAVGFDTSRSGERQSHEPLGSGVQHWGHDSGSTNRPGNGRDDKVHWSLEDHTRFKGNYNYDNSCKRNRQHNNNRQQQQNGRRSNNQSRFQDEYYNDKVCYKSYSHPTFGGKSEDFNRNHRGDQEIPVENARDAMQLTQNIPSCPVCLESFDLEENLPKSMKCGHTFCNACIHKIFKHSKVICPECRSPIPANDPQDFPPNVILVQILSSRLSLPSIRQKQVASGGRMQVSVHGSRCLDQGVQAEFYCTKCEQWVCQDCKRTDHSFSKKCDTVPIETAINQLKKQSKNDVEAGLTALSNVLADSKSYERALKACLLVMRASNESIETTLISVNDTQDYGHHKLSELTKEKERLDKVTEVEEFLSTSKKIKDQRSALQKWTSEEMSQMKFQNDFEKMGRRMLHLTLHLNETSSSRVRLLAQVETARGIKYHRLVLDAGRINVQAAEDVSDVNKTRALPIEQLKALVEPDSTLTFLDLCWGGRTQGRVYIRLLGNTIRGRQFQALCLGDQGPCFKNTRFHRIWWKGSPGEHIWGGDYNQGDGSGGASIFPTNIELSPPLSPLAVTEGLVAGRYEKENISTIFRIYTETAHGAKDEAAFGRVEYGIDVVKGAIQYSKVKEILISDCGIIIET